MKTLFLEAREMLVLRSYKAIVKTIAYNNQEDRKQISCTLDLAKKISQGRMLKVSAD